MTNKYIDIYQKKLFRGDGGFKKKFTNMLRIYGHFFHDKICFTDIVLIISIVCTYDLSAVVSTAIV